MDSTTGRTDGNTSAPRCSTPDRHLSEPGSEPSTDPLSHALYVAARASTALHRPGLAALGLTFPQYLVLGVLWERGHATVQHLGEVLRLDSGTLSPLLKRLERAGLATRRRVAQDERLVEVRLTPGGKALREPARRVAESVRRNRAPVPVAHESLVSALYELARQSGAENPPAFPGHELPGSQGPVENLDR
jgi:DNA-binding MarR family transcriptional regulator